MRKIRSLTGMPVICSRRKIGRLVQAQLSDDLKRLVGIWVDGGLRGTRYIPSEHLSMIGTRSVIADVRGRRKRCTGQSLFYRAVSTDGSRIGAVVDAEVDEISFLVGALELSRGFWDDLFQGRSRVEVYSLQNGNIIVQDSAQILKGRMNHENDEGVGNRHDYRRYCSHHVRRDELAD